MAPNLSIYLLNIDQLSKFFHWHTAQNEGFITNFCRVCGERIMKIYQYLGNICTKVWCRFFDSQYSVQAITQYNITILNKFTQCRGKVSNVP